MGAAASDRNPKAVASRYIKRAHTAIGLLLIVTIVVGASLSGALRPLDDAFAALRFHLLQRQPGDSLTVVEIDVPSLRAAGRWPWERERYAVAIGKLLDAGASIVAFDVDFSARSTPEGDAAMQRVIAAHPGQVVLPTFVQSGAKAGERGQVDAMNLPMAGLAENALLASVNVPVDVDGKVRSYTYGFERAGGFRQSLAGSLAGANRDRPGGFLVDYGVDVGRIDRLSFDDVYAGRFDPALVRGRAILVGATALELGDEFATPRYGTLPGVYVHALAFESLAAGRVLRPLPAGFALVLAALAAFALRPTRRGSSLQSLALRHAATATAVVIGPLALHAATAVVISPGAVAVAQTLALVWATREELARRARAIIEEREAGLLHLALHEPETGLPNRRALLAEGAAMSDSPAWAVVAVGLDRFAAMRGAVGYSLSNEIVGAVAARCAEVCEGVRVFHLSTSVLGLILFDESEATLRARLHPLVHLDPAYLVREHTVDAFVRIGVAYAGRSGETAEQLLEHATVALDAARKQDRRAVVHQPADFADPLLTLGLVSELRAGLKRGELWLDYQPKLDLATGTISGVEGLIRWRHPVRGRIPPDAFIQTAEEVGAIRGLTEWTLRQALADSGRLRAEGRALLVSVNISGRLLADAGFRDQVLEMVQGRAHELCLEITETAVIDSPEAATAAIATFRAAGLKISIDDYGVGLSSLSYLKMLEADELKVDKSLVTAVCNTPRDRTIIKSTVELAHSLGMKVVAEGVESESLLNALSELGCDLIQGYFVAKPLPLAELTVFLDGFERSRPGRKLARAG